MNYETCIVPLGGIPSCFDIMTPQKQRVQQLQLTNGGDPRPDSSRQSDVKVMSALSVSKQTACGMVPPKLFSSKVTAPVGWKRGLVSQSIVSGMRRELIANLIPFHLPNAVTNPSDEGMFPVSRLF